MDPLSVFCLSSGRLDGREIKFDFVALLVTLGCLGSRRAQQLRVLINVADDFVTVFKAVQCAPGDET
jgi:hypothetical protein